MTGSTALTAGQVLLGERVDALDLEPIAFKLMHPHPGETVMGLGDADQVIAAYRGFLKLSAWYPHERIVPSRAIDEAWHAHILDTAKYAADCEAVFGHFVHHFPYFGLRGAGDEADWRAAYERTRELFGEHFGIGLSGTNAEAAPACHVNGASCKDGEGRICVFDESITCEKSTGSASAWQRPRPDRTTVG